jgi:hypothetical protein
VKKFHFGVLIPAVALLAAAATGGSQPARVLAAGSATIDGSAPVSWDFGPVGGLAGGGVTDSFDLTVQLPAPDATYYSPDTRQGTTHAAVLTVTLTWTGNDPTQAVTLSAVDPASASVGNDTLGAVNDGSDTNVFTLQNPLNTKYTLTASTVTGTSSTTVAPHAVATLRLIDLAAQPQPAQPQGVPGFDTFHIPLSLMPITPEETNVLHGRAFGEPSIGVDPRTDAVMYQAGLYTIKGTFTQPPNSTQVTSQFSDVSDAPLTNSASEDAILAVDPGTGRTFVSQLSGACSIGAVSTDDGTSWIPSPHPCQTPAGPDHQTIGAGPYAPPLAGNPGLAYPDAVYYCSQSVVTASCALSVDGGLTYGAASPTWTSSQCFGLHGHVKVAPDGTAYVPDKACGAPECLIVTSTAGPNCHPGFAVSTNNGLNWTVHTINDGHFRYYTTGDPSIGIGSAGTMYYGYGDRDGHPKIAVCTSQGTSCGPSKDVGGSFHIENTEMATVVAGDDNRAAFAFLGSTMPGDDQQASFHGTWNLYVATTYDGGNTWTTTDVTPNAPIQRGCIEFNASCPSARASNDQRNLLDFNDLTIDREGRIVAAYTDGCQQDPTPAAGHGSCANDATRLSGLNPEIEGPAIARQSCGLGLYAAFDAGSVPCSLTANTPETARTGALVLGGLGAVGIGIVVQRRRRNRTMRAA